MGPWGAAATAATGRRELIAEAERHLSDAYRLLGDAADCLRGLGIPDALAAIGNAKDKINDAKNITRPGD